MTPAPASVVATDTAERVAWLAGHSGSAVIVVTDEAGRFLGLVLAQRLLPLLVSEHELDLAPPRRLSQRRDPSPDRQ